MENMKLYEMARTVPQEAIKPIQAGRLKGMSDINPMYRIKRLTEMFGPCGVGWWYEIARKEITFDEITNQKCAFVDINLYYTDPETGHDSHAIPGTGGASFVATERNGPYMSDECYKMALTDAISVAAKSLGIGADVYFEKDKTKYTNQEKQPDPDAFKPGDKIEAPKPVWSFRDAMFAWCQHYGITPETFGKFRDALVGAGIVENIPSRQMSVDQFNALCTSIQQNFGDQLKVTA